MKSKSIRPTAVLLVLVLCFIWGNSLLPASVSSALSLWVKAVVSSFLGEISSDAVAPTHTNLRKIAHVTEFAILGAVVASFFRWEFKKHGWHFLLSGIVVAFFDETIQIFVEGRGAQVSDIWIDLGGYFLGGLVCFGIGGLLKKRKNSN